MQRRQGVRRQNERGQGTVEYGLIIVLVALFCLSATEHMGQNVSTFYFSLATKVGAVAGN